MMPIDATRLSPSKPCDRTGSLIAHSAGIWLNTLLQTDGRRGSTSLHLAAQNARQISAAWFCNSLVFRDSGGGLPPPVPP